MVGVLTTRVWLLRAQLHQVGSICTFLGGSWPLVGLDLLGRRYDCIRCVLGCRLLSSPLLLLVFDLLTSALAIEEEVLEVAAG